MIFLVCAIIQLVVGVWDIVAGIVRANLWQGLFGVALLALCIYNLIIWRDEHLDSAPAPARSRNSHQGIPVALYKGRKLDSRPFIFLGPRCTDSKGDFTPLFVRIPKSQHSWLVFRPTDEQLKLMGDMKPDKREGAPYRLPTFDRF